MPQAGSTTEYCHGDLFEMAAAHLFHIVNNHSFPDGNKRTEIATALVSSRCTTLRSVRPT
ncbi:MAG TPA: Fic family protein [bacterium]|nr:Fic family protein [bacterium]